MHNESELIGKGAETWRVLAMGINKESKRITGLGEVIKAVGIG